MSYAEDMLDDFFDGVDRDDYHVMGLGLPEPIDELKESDIGRYVVYKPELESETGRIKSFDNGKQVAWVVYKADKYLDSKSKWKNYTAASTKYEDIYFIED